MKYLILTIFRKNAKIHLQTAKTVCQQFLGFLQFLLVEHEFLIVWELFFDLFINNNP